MNSGLYREEILEHYRNPQNFRKLNKFDIRSGLVNPFCGDEIEIFVKMQPQGLKVVEIGFIGRGCAISIASCSILTEYAKEKSKSELTNFSQEDMLRLIDIPVSETRKKCVLLGWAVLRDCLEILYGKI